MVRNRLSGYAARRKKIWPGPSVVEDALNYQVSRRMQIYRRMKNCFKNVVMAGDGIVNASGKKNIRYKTEWRILADANTGQPITDEQAIPLKLVTMTMCRR